MPEEVLFEMESNLNRDEIATYLRTLADSLDSGRVSLSSGEQSIELDVPARPTFEVKVERETPSGGGPGELGLEVELEWPEDGGDGGTGLTIE